MKLIITGRYDEIVEFLLDNSNEDIKNNLQEEFDNIMVLATMIDYKIECAYNSSTRQMHCYFMKNGKFKFTLSFYKNEANQFTQYSIFSNDKNDGQPIYRKRNNPSFWRVLKNFKRML